MSDQNIDPEPNKKKGDVQRAVALQYDPENDRAPKVIASGKGFMADQIISIAKRNDLPIKDDVILAEALSQVDLNQEIPPELYAVVAEVFAFVYRLRKKYDNRSQLNDNLPEK
ncbi:MAG: EscU/YscU/HrcU family type III secretion system export apparatus switch protein [Anaerolineaceae bacterium]|nr:EscU/YscU/HrcU family type III secretion system export apparatus switch protein [Anaerolineaceae bacterium]